MASVQIPAVDPGIPAADAEKLASDLSRTLTHQEAEDSIKFLAKEFNTTPEAIRARMNANRTTIDEIVARAHGFKPDSKGWSDAVTDYMSWAYRNRKIANPDLVRTIATCVAIEMVTTVLSERAARGDRFWDQIDYVVADLITFTLGEVVLTWVSHNTATAKMTLRGEAPNPASIFDGSFSGQARRRLFVRNGLLLGGVGFGIGIIGNGTVELYHGLKDRGKPGGPTVEDRVEKVLWNAFLVGTFMSVSSNFRYQLLTHTVAGIGTRVPNALLRTAITAPLVYGNNFVGGMTYVYWTGLAGAAVDRAKKLGYEIRMNSEPGDVLPVAPGH
jgi:hypothetical protein